jgi:AraC-like DNA-binding protein
MDIHSIDIRYVKRDGFISDSMDGIQHIKVLPWLSLVQSKEGSYDVSLGIHPPVRTGKGGFFIAPSGVAQDITHRQDEESGRMHCRWIFIDVEINGESRLEELYVFPKTVPDPQRSELDSLFDLLFSSSDIFDDYVIYYKITKILLTLATPKPPSADNRLSSLTSYITNNLQSSISVDELAKHIHTSVSNVYAIFKKHFGTSPIAYINNARLSLAAEYLRSTNMAISEIGQRVGICDPFYFSKLFRRAYRLSPKQYRIEMNKDA